MDKKRITQIDTLKGFAIFMVVFGHAITQKPVDLRVIPGLEFIHLFFWSFHMPVFFFCAGYCYSAKTGYCTYLKRKFIQLMIPYYVFTLIDMFPRAAFPNLVSKQQTIKEAVISILLYGGNLWFLMSLFLTFVIYRVIDNLLFKNFLLLLVTSLFFVILSIFGVCNVEILCLNKISIYLCFFHFGVVAKRSGFSFTYREWIKTSFKVICPLLILIHCCVIYKWFDGYDRSPVWFLTAIIGMLSLIMLAESQKFSFVFSRFGKFTLQIYLLNSIVIFAIRTLLPLLGVDNPYIIFLMNFTFGFLGSYLVTKYILCRFGFIKLVLGMPK